MRWDDPRWDPMLAIHPGASPIYTPVAQSISVSLVSPDAPVAQSISFIPVALYTRRHSHLPRSMAVVVRNRLCCHTTPECSDLKWMFALSSKTKVIHVVHQDPIWDPHGELQRVQVLIDCSAISAFMASQLLNWFGLPTKQHTPNPWPWWPVKCASVTYYGQLLRFANSAHWFATFIAHLINSWA